jgi:UDP-N-acetylglucosamine--N-acetylmuramyl-(pentapeptide) pyrophosphoryl-undecaprenol N-acetylglucosamine transferase
VKVLMSGGGTAGHVYPALTVAERLLDAGHDSVTFVGTPGGLEARLVPEAGVAFSGLPARGFDRSRPLSLALALAVIAISTLRMIARMARNRPDVVVGFGGYVSLPVGFAAAALRVPLVLHEQNSVPGLANRYLSRWASRVAITYPGSRVALRHPERVVVTGNPVRAAVLQADPVEGRRRHGVLPGERLLVVFGGSRGARHINEAMVRIAPLLLADGSVRVLHVAGRDEVATVRDGLGVLAEDPRYRLVEYLDDMGHALAAADVVVARAGATSIAEITALGRPAVLVPYPYATDDHQTLNAEACASAKAAYVVPDGELDSDEFGGLVVGLLSDAARRDTMAAASRGLGVPDAAERLVDVIRAAAFDHADSKGELQ